MAAYARQTRRPGRATTGRNPPASQTAKARGAANRARMAPAAPGAAWCTPRKRKLRRAPRALRATSFGLSSKQNLPFLLPQELIEEPFQDRIRNNSDDGIMLALVGDDRSRRLLH